MRGPPAIVVVLALGGCRQILGIEEGRVARDGDITEDDALPIDSGPIDALDLRCFGSGSFAFCLSTAPSGSLTLGNVDTSTCTGGVLVEVGGQTACVIAAGSINVTDTVITQGSRPLVLAASIGITIAGALDASSLPNNPGPNANAAQCTTTATSGVNNINGGGGGAGGTFGTTGGNGGSGGGGLGGVAPVPLVPNALRGGCRGGTGGQGSGLVGAAGDGGGAVYLATHGTLMMTSNALLHANGARGAGGTTSRGGGGGGGSGGMIVIHAGNLSIANSAKLTANGGGGGGGAGPLDPGEDGNNPNPSNPTSTANGGSTNSAGRARGGNGAAGTTTATPGEAGANGAGGGGGGHGVIRVLRPSGFVFPTGSISPNPSS